MSPIELLWTAKKKTYIGWKSFGFSIGWFCLFPDSREDLEVISERKPDLESLEGNSEVRSEHLENVMYHCMQQWGIKDPLIDIHTNMMLIGHLDINGGNYSKSKSCWNLILRTSCVIQSKPTRPKQRRVPSIARLTSAPWCANLLKSLLRDSHSPQAALSLRWVFKLSFTDLMYSNYPFKNVILQVGTPSHPPPPPPSLHPYLGFYHQLLGGSHMFKL